MTQAAPLATIDLASEGDWTVCKELDGNRQSMPVPNQLSVKGTKNRWVDFRRQIAIPAVATGHATILHLESINDGGAVFVDDRSAGTADYGLFPADVELTPFVTAGKSATLTLRCCSRADYYRPAAFPRGANGLRCRSCRAALSW